MTPEERPAPTPGVIERMEQALAANSDDMAARSGPLMGVAATGRRVTVPDNRGSVGFASVVAQPGVDVFDGRGREHYDDGSATPPHPEGGETR